jgi:hypothetical protein
MENVSEIEVALQKENITDKVILRLKTDYLGLKINGLNDKEGFKIVEDARKECKDLRVLAEKTCKVGREYAIKVQKEWIAKEKEITGAISEVENYLAEQSNKIKEEQKRIEFEADQLTKLPQRKDKLASIDIVMEDAELLKIDDTQFNNLFVDLYTKQLREKADKIQAERDELEKQKAEQKRKEEAEIAEKKRAEEIEKAKQEAIEEFKRKQELNVVLNVPIPTMPITEPAIVECATEPEMQITEKDKLKNWIDNLKLSEISVIKTDNMLLAVELKDKLDAYKKWAISQIEQKAK